MASSGLSFHWFPSPLVVAKDIKAGALALNDFAEPLALSIDPASGAITRTFDTEGPGWAAWSPTYEDFAMAYPNVGILWQSGELVGSVTDDGNYAVTMHTLEWTGAASPFYWEFHERGTKKMPARQFVGLDEEAIAEITVIFDAYLDSVVAEMAGEGFTFAGSGRGSKIRSPTGQFSSMRGF